MKVNTLTQSKKKHKAIFKKAKEAFLHPILQSKLL